MVFEQELRWLTTSHVTLRRRVSSIQIVMTFWKIVSRGKTRRQRSIIFSRCISFDRSGDNAIDRQTGEAFAADGTANCRVRLATSVSQR